MSVRNFDATGFASDVKTIGSTYGFNLKVKPRYFSKKLGKKVDNGNAQFYQIVFGKISDEQNAFLEELTKKLSDEKDRAEESGERWPDGKLKMNGVLVYIRGGQTELIYKKVEKDGKTYHNWTMRVGPGTRLSFTDPNHQADAGKAEGAPLASEQEEDPGY